MTYCLIAHTLLLFSSLSLTQKELWGRMSTLLFFHTVKAGENLYWRLQYSVHMAPAQYSKSFEVKQTEIKCVIHWKSSSFGVGLIVWGTMLGHSCSRSFYGEVNKVIWCGMRKWVSNILFLIKHSYEDKVHLKLLHVSVASLAIICNRNNTITVLINGCFFIMCDCFIFCQSNRPECLCLASLYISLASKAGTETDGCETCILFQWPFPMALSINHNETPPNRLPPAPPLSPVNSFLLLRGRDWERPVGKQKKQANYPWHGHCLCHNSPLLPL